MPEVPDNSSASPSIDDMERLAALARSIKGYRTNIHYVSYKQAEKDCEELAYNILKVYEPEELKSFHFEAIPRGGFIVLGMLSYILDLKPHQLMPANDQDKPLMIVDDCALTGARLSKAISETNSSHMAIATLYSHHDLRKSIIENEPKVKHCFAACNLKDRARENYPDKKDYETWKKRTLEYMGGKRYWVGQPDLVGFAWNEPDYPFWNPVTEQIEDGWRSLPPHKCLKNKTRLGILPNHKAPVEFQMSSSVVSGVFDDIIWLVHLDKDEVFALDGIASQIWRVLIFYGNIEATVTYLKDKYEVDENILRIDVQELADDLLSKGLIERTDGKP